LATKNENTYISSLLNSFFVKVGSDESTLISNCRKRKKKRERELIIIFITLILKKT